MSNANYVKGRAFEYARMKVWRGRGYGVVRTAGSHGPFDLIAFMNGRVVELIQCKTVKTFPQANRIMTEFLDRPPLKEGPYHQVMEIWIQGDRELWEHTI